MNLQRRIEYVTNRIVEVGNGAIAYEDALEKAREYCEHRKPSLRDIIYHCGDGYAAWDIAMRMLNKY